MSSNAKEINDKFMSLLKHIHRAHNEELKGYHIQARVENVLVGVEFSLTRYLMLLTWMSDFAPGRNDQPLVPPILSNLLFLTLSSSYTLIK